MCDRVALFNRGRIALSGSVTELGAAGARRRPCDRCRGSRCRCSRAPRRVPGVVRVQRDGAATLSGRLRTRSAAPRSPAFSLRSSELIGIRFAEPSLNEVYTRYFDEMRDARVAARPLPGPARHRPRQGGGGPSKRHSYGRDRGAGFPDSARLSLVFNHCNPRDDWREPVSVSSSADDGAGSDTVFVHRHGWLGDADHRDRVGLRCGQRRVQSANLEPASWHSRSTATRCCSANSSLDCSH